MKTARLNYIRKMLNQFKAHIYGKDQARHEPEDQAISDLLVDLLDFAKARGHDPRHIWEWAQRNAEAEGKL